MKSDKEKEVMRMPVKLNSSLLAMIVLVSMSAFVAGSLSYSLPGGRGELSFQDSPFAIHDPDIPMVDSVESVKESGAKWVRYAGANGIVWDAVERQKGRFSWERSDRLYLETHRNGINMLVSTITANKAYGVEHGFAPGDMKSYLDFLKKAVERYDGDGIDDAPGSPVVALWQIENEPDIFWKDTPESYAVVLKESYKAVRQANPGARVVIAGVGTPAGFAIRRQFYVRVFKKLKEIQDSPGDRYFDIFDFHWYPFTGEYDYLHEPPGPGGTKFEFREYVRDIRNKLEEYGYRNIPIYITETGQYTGSPAVPKFMEHQIAGTLFRSEKKQALFLLKLYVYALAEGIEKVFWVTLTEWHNFGGDPNGVFDNVGLIHNPANKGLSHKKLAYYTYRKMVEKLEGSAWNHIETIRDQGGVQVYRFNKGRGSIRVAWNDNEREERITLGGIASKRLIITRAVPAYDSGKDIKSWDRAFEEDEVVVKNNETSIVLNEIPVFIEEK